VSDESCRYTADVLSACGCDVICACVHVCVCVCVYVCVRVDMDVLSVACVQTHTHPCALTSVGARSLTRTPHAHLKNVIVRVSIGVCVCVCVCARVCVSVCLRVCI